MSNNAGNQQETVLWIRFIGEGLETRSVPINELGQTLVSVQQIINKAYLFTEGRLKGKAALTQRERERLALQISSHRKDSDAYGLISCLPGSDAQGLISSLAADGLVALDKYASETVVNESPDGVPSDQAQADQMYTASIFAQVNNLVKHIGGVSGVRAIELSTKPDQGVDAVVLKRDTKLYLGGLRRRANFSNKCSIRGIVTRLYTIKYKVGVRRVVGKVVHWMRGDLVTVTLIGTNPEADFENIRRNAPSNAIVTFKGQWVFSFGPGTLICDKFNAESVSFPLKARRAALAQGP